VTTPDDIQRAIEGARVDPSKVRVPDLSTGHVPATPAQWRSALSDSALIEQWTKLTVARSRVEALVQMSPKVAGKQAPRRVRELIAAAEIVIAEVEAVCWFIAAPDSVIQHGDLVELADCAKAIAHQIVELLPGDHASDAEVARGDRIVARIGQEIERTSSETPSANLATVFGVEPRLIEDLGGLDASARLRVATTLNHDELEQLSRSVLRHLLSDNATYAPTATSILAPMLLSERPLIAHVVALHTAEALVNMNPGRTAEILRDYRGYLPENWATQRTITANEKRIRTAAPNDHEEVALAEAELSWACTEGPIRRLGWTCLRLYGADDAPMPMLGELQDRLDAQDEVITRALANAIVPAWRNAVAHREVSYDPVRRKLRLESDLVTPDRLREARQLGYAIAYGFDCGVAVARATSPALAAQLDLGADIATEPHLVAGRLADLMAGHRILCERIEVMDDRVIVRAQNLHVRDAALILTEFAEASDLYQLGDVELQIDDRPALRVPANILAELIRQRQTAPDKSLPASALWAVIASGRADLLGDSVPVYDEIGQRAVAAAIQVFAGFMGIDVGRPIERRTDEEARSELDQIEVALTSAWGILPGEVPAQWVDLPADVRALRNALGNDPDFRAAGRRLHQSMRREDLPELPWFAPFPDPFDGHTP
jgi:hypothetical protein